MKVAAAAAEYAPGSLTTSVALAAHARAGNSLHRTAGRLSVPAVALLQPVGRHGRAAASCVSSACRITVASMESRTFWLSLKNTLIITLVSQMFIVVLANILAAALIEDFRGKWFVRLLILLPWVAPISLGIDRVALDLRFHLQHHQLDRSGRRHPRAEPVADLARRSRRSRWGRSSSSTSGAFCRWRP